MFYISLGAQLGEAEFNSKVNETIYKIQFNNQIYQLPELIYEVWRQFLPGEYYENVQSALIEEGLSEDFLDDFLELMVEEGFMIKTTSVEVILSNLIPQKSRVIDYEVNEDEKKLLNLIDGKVSIEGIKQIFLDEGLEQFYEIVRQALNNNSIYFIKNITND